MSNMRTFDSSTTLTVSEGYDLTNQQYYSKRRCQCACGVLNRRVTFRVWHILLFLLIVAAIIAVLGLLVAMYGPGNPELRYSARSVTERPGGTDNGEITPTTPTEPPVTTGKETEEPTPTKKTEQPASQKPTTPLQTTVKTEPPTTPTQPKPSATSTPSVQTSVQIPPTTAAPTTEPTTEATTGPTTTQVPTPPEPSTTAPPTTVPPTTVPSKNILECGVAIVGAGTGGLLIAYSLLEKKNETNVCIFEREERAGGKIFDHNFTQVPDVVVGLGQWNIDGENYGENDLSYHLFDKTDHWSTKLHRVEARGVFTDTFKSLKSKAFPTLLDRAPMNNKTLEKTAEFIYAAERNFSQFSTADTFLSYELSPEGAKLMADSRYGFKGDYMQTINPMSYRTYLETERLVASSSDHIRPPKGMSQIITNLIQKVESRGGIIYRKETVTSINKEGDKFVLQTTNLTVKANKTVITAGPAAFKKIKGDVIQNITDHVIFNSIVSVPAFQGAAVYDRAWWNDSTAAQKNNSLKAREMFTSSSDCLGITMPYQGVGPNGRVVLHTIANNGGCSDKWGKILQISENEINKELKRALKYKFQRDDIPDPLETKYKYWEEGFWFFQKPGVNINLTTIRQWAKRPLAGQDVFLVDRAFYNFGGWLDDTIRSAYEALQEGWKSDFPFYLTPPL